ncbi:hypothetical protein [Hymenobacter cellulosilyticus]|uniref:Uncharacterized protein n=1 Tax=Hymenobacter cellulosilyticus TaxID=2932248 RepID=A0A8T9QGZ6_9BACT|nr:hypothetical protein [Hymenobacter cellulosilyticus]UOQ75120.1 hypothetical protein MUN79_29030 [Hymenobacter cellulosilyticus]
MATPALLSQLLTLGQALEDTPARGEDGSTGPLEQARTFVLTHLRQEPRVPYRADELLELLAPSPHIHWSWAEERELVLESLTMLHQLWRR